MRAPLLLLLVAVAARADIYVWTDKDGKTRYSSRAPKEGAAKRQPKVYKGRPKPAPKADAVKPRVELYTTSWCPQCQNARAYLNSRDVGFLEYDVEADKDAYARFQSYGGLGVPLALIDGKPVTGFAPAAYDRLLGLAQ